MTQCYSANKKLSSTKNATEVTLRLSSNIIGTNETNFLYKFC